MKKGGGYIYHSDIYLVRVFMMCRKN